MMWRNKKIRTGYYLVTLNPDIYITRPESAFLYLARIQATTNAIQSPAPRAHYKQKCYKHIENHQAVKLEGKKITPPHKVIIYFCTFEIYNTAKMHARLVLFPYLVVACIFF